MSGRQSENYDSTTGTVLYSLVDIYVRTGPYIGTYKYRALSRGRDFVVVVMLEKNSARACRELHDIIHPKPG